jgi:hypothetical protein
VTRLILCACVPALVAACGLAPERPMEDPDCEHCYRLSSGIKYKTFAYYDP